MPVERYLPLLQQVCNLPTAPYLEQYVVAFLTAWARVPERRKYLKIKRDPAGNIYLTYRHGKPRHAATGQALPPLVIEAHMDHPGFVITEELPDHTLRAKFRGGVKASHFVGATAALWIPDATPNSPSFIPAGRWLPTPVIEAHSEKPPPGEGGDYISVTLANPTGTNIPPGTLGMWHLPEATRHNQIFQARVCDDLAGIAAGLCLLDDLIAQQLEAHVILLLSRAEEVGFAGTIAVARNRWLPLRCPIIGLETSKASPLPPTSENLPTAADQLSALPPGTYQGQGPVVRVGDKSGIFSPGLTHFLCQAAAGITDEDSSFRWQRKLMDGGTCSTTAFVAYGYDSASLTLPLGNYHNMRIPGEAGSDLPPTAQQGPGIAPETIHIEDFVGVVRILLEAVRKYPTYLPRFETMRQRLEKLHLSEQLTSLFSTSNHPKAPEYLPQTVPAKPTHS